MSETLCAALAIVLRGGDSEIDAAGAHLWSTFWDLNRARQSGIAGWLAITAGEIAAWTQLTGNIMRPEEFRILRDMDETFLKAAAEKSAQSGANTPNGGISQTVEAGTGRDINTKAFDAVFG